MTRFTRFRARLNRLDFEYTLIGCTLLIMGALIQIGAALGAVPP